jgi:hypothetical protein
MNRNRANGGLVALIHNHKAFTPNFDEVNYRAFAEIGAGQKGARQLFQAGGAETIAESVSPYDKRPDFAHCPIG